MTGSSISEKHRVPLKLNSPTVRMEWKILSDPQGISKVLFPLKMEAYFVLLFLRILLSVTWNKCDDYPLCRKYHSSEFVEQVKHTRCDGKINNLKHRWTIFSISRISLSRTMAWIAGLIVWDCKMLSSNCLSFKTQMIWMVPKWAAKISWPVFL